MAPPAWLSRERVGCGGRAALCHRAQAVPFWAPPESGRRAQPSLAVPSEMVEPFGRFREVPRTVPPEPGDIALHDRRIQRAHGIAMPVEPSAKRVTGA